MRQQGANEEKRPLLRDGQRAQRVVPGRSGASSRWQPFAAGEFLRAQRARKTTTRSPPLPLNILPGGYGLSSFYSNRAGKYTGSSHRSEHIGQAASIELQSKEVEQRLYIGDQEAGAIPGKPGALVDRSPCLRRTLKILPVDWESKSGWPPRVTLERLPD